MVIWKEVTKYDPDTGKPHTAMAWEDELSDFSGLSLHGEDHEEWPYGSITIDYDGQDPCYGSGGEEFELRQKGIDIYAFMADAFVVQWQEHPAVNQDYIGFAQEHPEANFCDYLRDIRTKTALRLLKIGIIQPNQLSGFERD